MSAPIDQLLGTTGEPPQCRVFSEDIAVHWFPRGAAAGDACLCGKTAMREEPLYDWGEPGERVSSFGRLEPA